MKICRQCQIEIEQILFRSHNRGMKWRGEYSEIEYLGCRLQYEDWDGKVKHCIHAFQDEMNKHMKKYYSS
jgi:hypothetical protein